MKITKNRIAASIGLLLSLPTIMEGTSVLAGLSKPDQIVLPWLVMYNVAMALLSLYIIWEIWKKSNRGRKLAVFVFLMHFSVLAVLVFIYFTSGVVALKSIMAMSLRSAVWATICYLTKRNMK